jgi:His Kinase A (phospho-acceptor) domain
VRFDDMLATTFAQPTDDQGALVAAWMQTVDILAQGRSSINLVQRREAFARLSQLRAQVPVERRRIVAASLASRPLPLDVVAFFGADAPVVAAPLIKSVQLSTDEWQEILPRLPLPTRALLRERRDLPTSVMSMLAGFGASDRVLSAPKVQSHPGHLQLDQSQLNQSQLDQLQPEMTVSSDPPLPSEPLFGPSQISDLVARIERYRRDRPHLDRPMVLDEKPVDVPTAFRFESEADGVILWVEDVPRGAIIGINIGLIAEAGEHGVDGHAAGAFRKRTPFRDARMVIPGEGGIAGTWLISGTPWFNTDDGRFRGYRCTARRPMREENLAVPQTGLLGDGLPPDSVRQLVHELRTPLTAIRGFAEMISGQLLGPVLPPYRMRAQAIIDDARRLLALFDDLDAAAKLDKAVEGIRPTQPSDARRMLHGVAANLAAFTDSRDVHLRIASGTTEALLSVEAANVERMYTRLISTVIGLAGAGETIGATLMQIDSSILLTVDRPNSLLGQTEVELFDPSYGPAGEWPDAPALGLGFALRLIANMAKVVGGSLSVTDTELVLCLPALANSASNGSV